MAQLQINPARLRTARVQAALSQQALASRAGLKHTTVSQLELGKRPARLGTIRSLADALGVEPTAIADLTPEPTPV